MNEHKKPNHLIHEKSPYLLQHAFNPVNWYPWGEEAFSKAKSENKVVLLSIGYATCHWCHVMERESFEDQRTAELMNRYFVSIKLDREERPDLDKIYMDALHATGQQGGWPLNFFLTPDKMPIFGGTYFPPENRYGRKSFKEILTLVQRSWENNREDLVAAAQDLTNHLQNSENKAEKELLPDESVLEKSFLKYVELYDETHFGFIFNGPNKFPPSMAIEYLIDYSIFFQASDALEIAFNTVMAMKMGGIYDQIGGGISRYSTDHYWLVPHFEKMLYDNSLFLRVVCLLYKITKRTNLLKLIKEMTDYIQRDMALPEGGISSAEDADSEGEEGKFYLWSEEEFDHLIEDAELKKFWNVTSAGNFEGFNILNESFSGLNPFRTISEPNPEFEEKIAQAKRKLLSRRSNRIRPLRDDKVLMSWNCLYVQSLIVSFQSTYETNYLKESERIFEFLTTKMRTKEGHLFRRYREGDARFEGNLCDYAEFIAASLELFRETEKVTYLDFALETLLLVETNFSTGYGPFYDSIATNNDVLRRTVDGYDGVEPSGNSTMTHIYNFLIGIGINHDSNYEKTSKIFSYFSKELIGNTTSYPSMLDAFLKWRMKRTEVLVLYKKESKHEIENVLQFLRSSHLPNVIWLVLEEGIAFDLKDRVSLVSNRTAGTSHLIYVCHDYMCELPVKGLEKLREIIAR